MTETSSAQVDWINLYPKRPISPTASAAMDYAMAYAIPIAFGPENVSPSARKPYVATCAVVDTGEHQWLLTAWHVLKKAIYELGKPGGVCRIGLEPDTEQVLATMDGSDMVGGSLLPGGGRETGLAEPALETEAGHAEARVLIGQVQA